MEQAEEIGANTVNETIGAGDETSSWWDGIGDSFGGEGFGADSSGCSSCSSCGGCGGCGS